MPAIPLPSVLLGDGLNSAPLGFGGMGLSSTYGEADPEDSLRTLAHALDRGITLFDTANIYGNGGNEELFARFIRGRRERVTLATKFGLLSPPDPGGHVARGDAPYVRASLEASLARLGTDYVDLYYYHRVDTRVPIEETVGALAELRRAGLIRHIGLSEVTGPELERAAAIAPIAAVQSEWSLWSRDVEAAVIPTAARLGVGFVPYSPLGRGFLAGAVPADGVPADDLRSRFPRYSEELLAANLGIVTAVRDIAERLETSPASVALAWLWAAGRRAGIATVPIPGTRRADRVDSNLAALDVEFPAEDLRTLDGLYATVSGARSHQPAAISSGRE
ncbi:aldo/keto reductase [Mycetocola spongiae]|uniref:aldo/keto reductase n=1 Tax=Mycetocola spongiae TaxID=2859226 RepID=UPI001CF3D76D|nr:aldo/keto reductase [Mycetocola spongiae]UCR89558.1 aldo/keto reductase [Mycetocola spongiae]